MHYYSTFAILLAIVLTSCRSKQPDLSVAHLYAPGTISTHMSERDAALAKEGNLFLFSVQLTRQHSAICEATQFNGKWVRPKVAPFSGAYMDIEPVFHPDGRLFFVSNRPLPGETKVADYNIWYVSKTDEGWSSPTPLDTIINSPGNEFYPSFTTNGDMYFTATLEGGKGGEDIWVAINNDGQFLAPQNLGDSINTASFEYNSFISPDGSFLLYTTHGRGPGFGSGDIFVSFKDATGNWHTPINLGDKVNTKGMEFCPSLSPDGKLLFFTRRNIPSSEGERWSYFEMLSSFSSIENGQGNIYYMNADFIQNLK